ncbi:MAG: glycoside hydrolase family 3 N-terminal domain-containing protein [Lachnospiraceae bacterium]|nr:glycoside hydrolase family 3 N-terminal domain-containing protein [Lachnospiraceae bacterium]
MKRTDIDLTGNPFYLSEDDMKWVEETKAQMTEDEKVGQLFVPMGLSGEDGLVRHLTGDCHIGGIMYRTGEMEEIRSTHEKLQNRSKIPLLIAANTEAGGDGMCAEGTTFGKPMAVAATNDTENAYRMGYVACKEGAAVGLNWSFAPIVDIDKEFHNPITNVRTFGSDVKRVRDMASAYLRGAKENQVAVTIKHFPGDGVDERDQHILTSVNSLTCEEWDESYGYVYQSLIDEGAQAVMVGHIAMPEYVRRINPEATDRERYLPASVSKELLSGLLRGKLGFNGVISTDSSCMVGYTTAMKRADAVVNSIANGCDIILFNKDLDEDISFIKQGLADGRISAERLDDAITRILALKASLKLHEKQKNGTLIPNLQNLSVIGCEQHKQWAKGVADASVTLVKDTQNLLPISPEKYKRVYLNVIQRKLTDAEHPVVRQWKELFEKEGFEVTVRDRTTTIEFENFLGINMTPKKQDLMGELYRSVGDFTQTKDLYVYILNIENGSNNTTARIDWNVIFGLGDDAPWFSEEIPVLFISTANPYHLFDAPMAKTFINSYHSNSNSNAAVMDKIMGRSKFRGVSPVDPFCGKEYLKL